MRSDNGGEYVNNDFSHYLTNHGILHETTCPQTPQQNGVAERKNRHLLETACSLLIGASVPCSSWNVVIGLKAHHKVAHKYPIDFPY